MPHRVRVRLEAYVVVGMTHWRALLGVLEYACTCARVALWLRLGKGGIG